MTTGERIKAARIRKAMTQQQLADKLGVQKAAINKYETGIIVNLKRDTIEQLSKILDVRPAYLMGWQDDPQKAVQKGQKSITLSRAQAAFIVALRAMTAAEKAKLYLLMQQMLQGDVSEVRPQDILPKIEGGVKD